MVFTKAQKHGNDAKGTSLNPQSLTRQSSESFVIGCLNVFFSMCLFHQVKFSVHRVALLVYLYLLQLYAFSWNLPVPKTWPEPPEALPTFPYLPLSGPQYCPVTCKIERNVMGGCQAHKWTGHLCSPN